MRPTDQGISAVTTHPNRIQVFISSRMSELKDLRAILHSELEAKGIDAFVYEAALGAHPNDPEQVSLSEVAQTDLFVLVIGESHGEITEREYDRARELNKPCLVYERLGRTTTDAELERFLKKLSGARGVPSRTTFQTAVDLAAKLAQDVQAWLVREYRRLSAARSATEESSRHRSELASSIERLSASTKHELPSGTSADLLAWQLQQWFEALEYPLDQEPTPGVDCMDLVVRVPARRRQFTRVLVRAKDGAVQSPDVAAARAEAAKRSLEEVWLVSFRRISPAAREAVAGVDGVFLYTLDDLIEEDVDFDRYFEGLDKEVQAADIDRLYVPLAVTVNEVDAAGVVHAQSSYDNVASYVDQWLADTDGEHLSLLGEFGTGKSWFALKYAHDAVRRYREAQQNGLARPRVPLVVRLREYARGFKDVGSLLTEFVFREHQINIRSFSVLEALNRMGRLLFIFDGFDEMAARVDQQKMVDNFWALAAVLGRGSKAILTCRTEYFQFASQARDVFSGKLRGSTMRDVIEGIRFQVATLQMFDEPRLRQVLSRRSDDARLIDAVLSNQRLVDLGRRPVMVDLLIEAMPGLKAESADLSQVYYKAIQRKMERDITLGRTFTSMADKIFFMCEMSWEMLSTQQLKIHYKEIPERVRKYFGASSGTPEEDYWRHDLLSQTMLVRDDDGYYRPAHKSLVEFFSAYKLSAQIGALKSDYLEVARAHVSAVGARQATPQRWSEYFRGAGGDGTPPLDRFALDVKEELTATWGRLALDNATTELLFSLCGGEELIRSAAGLRPLGEGTGTIAARVLEVAAFAGDLRGADLSGWMLEGCQLRSCDLSGVDLCRSSWLGGTLELVSLDKALARDAVFRNTHFVDVTLRGTDLTNCAFEGEVRVELNIIAAAWCADGQEEILVAVLADGRVAAISPLTSSVRPLDQTRAALDAITANDLAASLLGLRGPVNLGARKLTFVDSGWQRNKTWERNDLGDGLKAQFDVSFTGPRDALDVERLHIQVTAETTGKKLLDLTISDATDLDYGAPYSGTRALCVGRSGTWIAVVSGYANQLERAEIRRENGSQSVPLRDFRGSIFPRGPETIDIRGAAASPADTVVAIRERPNVIGFWRTADGTFLGRAVFSAAADGAIVNVGVDPPEALATLASGDHYGFRFEAAR